MAVDNQEAKQGDKKRDKEGELRKYYLVSGILNKKGKVKKGTVRPIINTVIAIDDIGSKAAIKLKQDDDGQANGIDANDKSMQLYMTDAIGNICNFDTGKEEDGGSIKTQPFKSGAYVKAISENAKLYFPPKRAILYNLLNNGYGGWVNNLRQVLTGIEGAAIADLPPSISLSEQLKAGREMLVEDYFIDPEGIGSTENEQAYSAWYKTNKTGKVAVLVLPRTRGIVISFSSEIYNGATVTIRDNAGKLCFHGAAEKNKTDKKTEKDKLAKHTATVSEHLQLQKEGKKSVGFTAVFYDIDDEMSKHTHAKDQIFRIEVQMPLIDDHPLSEKTYSFAEHFRFKINNLAGDFELINGDALSLEESMVKQFPSVYSEELITAGKKTEFATYAHFESTQRAYAAMATSIVGASSGTSGSFSGQKATRKIGQHLVNNVSIMAEPVYEGIGLKDILSIAFSVYDIKDSYAGGMADVDTRATGVFKGVTRVVSDVRAIAASGHAAFAGSEVSSAVSAFNAKLKAIAAHIPLPETVSSAATSTSTTISQLSLPAGMQTWLSSSHSFVSTYKVMDKLDIAGAVIGLGTSAVGIYEADASQDEANEQFQISATTYANLINMTPAKAEDDDATEADTVLRKKLEAMAIRLKNSYSQKITRSIDGEKAFVTINFQFDQYSFEANKTESESAEDENSVKEFVAAVNGSDLGADSIVHLVGHTCDRGNPGYNQSLSEKRAEAIAKAMKQAGAQFTIIPSGRGASEPGDNLSEEERRRVEAVIQINKAKCYYPSREGMGEFERYRALSLVYSRAENEQVAALIKSAIDAALCVPTAPVAAAKLLWEIGGLLMDAAALMDKLISGIDHVNLVAKHSNLMVESRDNLIAMTLVPKDAVDKRAVFLQTQYQLRAESLYGLMRLLIRCSIEADEKDADSFNSKIQYYRVQEYINTFVINDGWQLSKGVLLPITLDQHWIKNIEEESLKAIMASGDRTLLEKADALMERGVDESPFLTLVPGLSLAIVARDIYKAFNENGDEFEGIKDSILMNPIQGFDYLRFSSSNEFQAHQSDILTAQYQSFFPVHYMAAEDTRAFIGKFKNDFSGIEDNAYSLFCMSARDLASPEATNVGWVPLKERLDSPMGLSPVDQIRITVFLDHTKITNQITEGSICYMPVEVKQFRDAWKNIEGTATKDFIQKIEVKDLTPYERVQLADLGYLKKGADGYELVEAKPLYGAIFTPFFTYGPNRFYGTRPMARSIESWWESDEKEGEINSYEVDSVWGGGDTWEMDYLYQVTLANRSSSEKWVTHLVSEEGETKEYEEEFTITLNPKRIHEIPKGKGVFSESMLLRPHFLASRTEKESLPELFENAEVTFLLRNSESGQYFDPNCILEDSDVKSRALPEYARQMLGTVIGHFDWSKPVEVIILVVAEGLKKKVYEDLQLPWKTLPAIIKAIVGKDYDDGPIYQRSLNYIGEFSSSKGTAKFVQNENSAPLKGGLSELKEYLSDPRVVHGFKGLGGFDHDDRHVYATHVSLSYQAITGVFRKGLRPCGVKTEGVNLKSGTEVRFTVSTPGDSGLNSTRSKGSFYVDSPSGFDVEDSHWYPKPQGSLLADVEELNAQIDEDKKTGSQGQVYAADIYYSNWAKWMRLNDKDKWWSAKREERVNEWLNDEKGRAKLPGSPPSLTQVK